MSDHARESTQPNKKSRRVGEVAFASAILALSVLLLSQLGYQTTQIDRISLWVQPWFWPGLSLAGMTLCASLYLFGAWRDSRRQYLQWEKAAEFFLWLRSLEFAIWLMVYVFVTPVMGYLPTTLAFCVLLALRIGYRGPRMLGASVAFGIATVTLFKSFLHVKIPGGLVYDVFPDAIRNFLIRYL